MQNIMFWTCATFAIFASALCISAKNPIRAVLSLIATFLATAVCWLMLEAEFLAATLVLVYVGAVMVLFLFVVMMLDIGPATLRARFTRWFPIGVALAAGLFAAIYAILRKAAGTLTAHENLLSYAAEVSNTEMLGKLVFTNYLLQFEVAGIILLVAIIAAIGLIYRGPQARKVQRIAEQVAVDPKMRVRLVDGA
ncbi:MAG TPA: NADH-quinone oxidoreductase subunit J [Gammaproteobacteria bacterium]|nr:NADH-quinone oxidoreductase subunit J [Gammaproteobacteria bacterium]